MTNQPDSITLSKELKSGKVSLPLGLCKSAWETWNGLPAGTKAWIGLNTYVLGYDFYGMLTGKELLTEACYRACEDPAKRWIVTMMWAITTKHLFFSKFIPWLDPFHILALMARLIDGK